MKRILAMVCLAMLLLPALPAMAQDRAGTGADAPAEEGALFPNEGLLKLGAAVGLGLIIMGAARGIGLIGSHAVDAIARQPEAGGRIFTSMIIAAALIEGATLFAIVVVIIV
jgi:F-type H+-transporting ATPase subunit c